MAGGSMPSDRMATIPIVTVDVDDGKNGSPDRGGVAVVESDDVDPVELEARRMENAACYVLSRTGSAPGLMERVVSSPEDLRDVLELQQKLDFSSFSASASASSDNNNKALVVVHGLPLQYVQVLSSELGMQANVIKAIASRERYRQKQWSSSTGVVVSSYEYPELVESVPYRPRAADDRTKEEEKVGFFERDQGDVLGDPPRGSVSNAVEAIYCRATLWEGEKASVLFLDRPLWNDPLCFFEKMGRGEVRSLERRFWDVYERSQDSIASIPEVLGAVAFELWIEFFETLRPNPCTSISEFGDLFDRTQRGLERNLDASRNYGVVLQQQSSESSNSNDKSAKLDWQSMLERLERHRRLALDLRTLTAQEEARHHNRARSSYRHDNYYKKYDDDDSDNNDSRDDVIDRQDAPSNADENRRSLDRVSYLGAVLLPITIVSGILSMNEDFAPGGAMFYVFWAAAMPLTAATLLIIYADSIRREVVWVEASVTQGSRSNESIDFEEHADDDDDGKGNDYLRNHRYGKAGKKKKQGVAGLPQQQQQQTASMPNLEQGVAYSYTEPLPITERIEMSLPTPPGRDEEDFVEERPDDSAAPAVPPEPVMVLQSRFARPDRKKVKAWKRQELGWKGAGMCILRLAQVKKARRLPRDDRRR